MTDVLLFDEELVRLTFIVGIAVSVLVYERTHRTTGSLVVPGYIGASLLSPVALLTTGLNATLTWFLVARLLPRFAAVYGRTLFVVNIAVSVALSMLFGPVFGAVLPTQVPHLDTIGYVIPALIAYDMNRQGPSRTATTVAITGMIAATPALILVALRPAAIEPVLPVDTVLRGLDDFWLAIAALVSVGVATLLQAGHQLRCGGFIGAMYIGLMAGEPVAVIFVAIVALITYAFVQFVLKPYMIVFGRRKFAIVLMTGSVLSWATLEAAGHWLPGVLSLDGLPIAVLFVPALLANDMERTTVPEVLVGTTVAAAATVSTIVVLTGLVDFEPIPGWAMPTMLISGLVLALPRLWPGLDSIGVPEPPSLDPQLPIAQQL